MATERKRGDEVSPYEFEITQEYHDIQGFFYNLKTRTTNDDFGDLQAFTVYRTVSDFTWIYETLVELFPHIIVPPLPKSDLFEQWSVRDYDAFRVRALKLFLVKVSAISELRTCAAFRSFLSAWDKEFDDAKNEAAVEIRVGKKSFGGSVMHGLRKMFHRKTDEEKHEHEENSVLRGHLWDLRRDYGSAFESARDISYARKNVSSSYFDIAEGFRELSKTEVAGVFGLREYVNDRNVQIGSCFRDLAKLLDASGSYCWEKLTYADDLISDHLNYNARCSSAVSSYLSRAEDLHIDLHLRERALQKKQEKADCLQASGHSPALDDLRNDILSTSSTVEAERSRSELVDSHQQWELDRFDRCRAHDMLDTISEYIAVNSSYASDMCALWEQALPEHLLWKDDSIIGDILDSLIHSETVLLAVELARNIEIWCHKKGCPRRILAHRGLHAMLLTGSRYLVIQQQSEALSAQESLLYEELFELLTSIICIIYDPSQVESPSTIFKLFRFLLELSQTSQNNPNLYSHICNALSLITMGNGELASLLVNDPMVGMFSDSFRSFSSNDRCISSALSCLSASLYSIDSINCSASLLSSLVHDIVPFLRACLAVSPSPGPPESVSRAVSCLSAIAMHMSSFPEIVDMIVTEPMFRICFDILSYFPHHVSILIPTVQLSIYMLQFLTDDSVIFHPMAQYVSLLVLTIDNIPNFLRLHTTAFRSFRAALERAPSLVDRLIHCDIFFVLSRGLKRFREYSEFTLEAVQFLSICFDLIGEKIFPHLQKHRIILLVKDALRNFRSHQTFQIHGTIVLHKFESLLSALSNQRQSPQPSEDDARGRDQECSPISLSEPRTSSVNAAENAPSFPTVTTSPDDTTLDVSTSQLPSLLDPTLSGRHASSENSDDSPDTSANSVPLSSPVVSLDHPDGFDASTNVVADIDSRVVLEEIPSIDDAHPDQVER